MSMLPLTAGETTNDSEILVVHLGPDTLSYRIELDWRVSSDE
jgi:hypothetical protein